MGRSFCRQCPRAISGFAKLHSSLRSARGRIINMGSLGGQKPWATHAHYCSSKAALHMLTQVMAKALAPEIAVNCVAPGMIDTGIGEKDPALLGRLAAHTPMKKNGVPQDVVSAVMYFATAPHFITGQILTVDGGLESALTRVIPTVRPWDHPDTNGSSSFCYVSAAGDARLKKSQILPIKSLNSLFIRYMIFA